MPIKFTLSLLFFLIGLQFWSCSPEQYVLFSHVQMTPYKRIMLQDGNFETRTLDSGQIQPISDVVWKVETFSSTVYNPPIVKPMQSYALSYQTSFIQLIKVKDIEFRTINDYNIQYKAGDNISEQIDFVSHANVQDIIDGLNKTIYEKRFQTDIPFYFKMKTTPQDTSEVILQIILHLEDGSFLHSTSSPVIAF